jgi:hypothetical protein
MDDNTEEFALECYSIDKLEKGSLHDERIKEFCKNYNLTEEEIKEIYQYYYDERKELQDRMIKRIEFIKQIKIYKC